MWVFNNSGYFRRLWCVFELNVFLRRQGVDQSVQVMPVVVPSLILLHTVWWFVFYSLFEILWETWTQTLSRAVRFGETWWWLVIFVPIVWDAICHAKGWDFDAFVVSGVVQIWANVCNHSGHRDILCPCILHGFYSTITCWWTVSCIPQITPFATSEVPGKRRLGTGSCRRFPFIGWSALKRVTVLWFPPSILKTTPRSQASKHVFVPLWDVLRFDIHHAECSCCSFNHLHPETGEHIPCDRELICETVTQAYGNRGDSGEERLKAFNSTVRNKLANRILASWGSKAAKLRWRFKNRKGTLGSSCVIICQARWGGVFFARFDKRSEHFRKLWYNNSKFLLQYVDVVCCCFQT